MASLLIDGAATLCMAVLAVGCHNLRIRTSFMAEARSAKFFGRAGLMSFLSSVLEHQRPALFQSLLFEACGRTVNPVTGAVGLLWTGNWHACQAAVQTVLRSGTLRPIPEFVGGGCTLAAPTGLDEASKAEAVVCTDTYELSKIPSLTRRDQKGLNGGASMNYLSINQSNLDSVL